MTLELGEKICPRCKVNRLYKEEVMNALSRRADVYICVECGNIEAFKDYFGKPDDTGWVIDYLMDVKNESTI